MSITRIQQPQISGTLASRVSDSVSNANLLKANRTIEDDLNSIRTQIKLIMGTSAWTDNLSGSQDLADIYAALRVSSISAAGPTAIADFTNKVYVADSLFVSGSIVIAQDLTVNGTTTTVNTTNLEIKDAVIGLGFASGTIQQAVGDRGWIGGLAGANNVAAFWDDSLSEFAFARTTNSATASLPITISSYSNLHVANIQGSIITASLGFTGSLTKLVDGTSYLVAGSNVTITTGSNGSVTIAATSTTTSPASPDTSIQFNNGGSFGGSANFTFAGSKVYLTGTLAVGDQSIASGDGSFAQGYQSKATGGYSHAIGTDAQASGINSYAEGSSTRAFGIGSHAQNDNAHAVGGYSHAGGIYTIASGSGQTVVGKYNKRDNSNSLFVIGNGTGDSNANRSDIFLVDSTSAVVSGTLSATQGLSGSLTRLVDGTSYLIAGSAITITSASNGAVTITGNGAANNTTKGYLLGNSAHINTGTGVVTFGPAGANLGTLSTAADEYLDVYLNGVYLAYGYDITTITTTTFTLDSTITATFTSDDIISITLRNTT